MLLHLHFDQRVLLALLQLSHCIRFQVYFKTESLQPNAAFLASDIHSTVISLRSPSSRLGFGSVFCSYWMSRNVLVSHNVALCLCGGHRLNCERTNHSCGICVEDVLSILAMILLMQTQFECLSPHSVSRCTCVSLFCIRHTLPSKIS